MLSIASAGAGAGAEGAFRYLSCAEEYYFRDAIVEGRWYGRAAETLGREGAVTREEFREFFDARLTDGPPLVQNLSEGRHAGWDLTFSAPKSVSTLWGLSDSETREVVTQCHRAAVEAALTFVQSEAAYTRRGRGGATIEKAEGMAFALYQHDTSRALDPQLHTHAFTFNLCTRFDGSTGTLIGREIFKAKMLVGALYRAELASQLQERLGVAIRPEGGLFEIEGVSPELMRAFSKRRAAIEAALEARGLHSARAAAVAALDTREAKTAATLETLQPLWSAAAAEHGFEWEACINRTDASADLERRQNLAPQVVDQLTRDDSSFSDRQMLRRVAESAPGTGMSAAAVRDLTATFLETDPSVVALGREESEFYFTTKAILELEEKLLRDARAGEGEVVLPVENEALTAAQIQIERKHDLTLSKEQSEALRHVTQGEGNVVVVDGLAGTGKTALLEAARVAWEAEGYTVIGAAFSGKAARALEAGSGIASETLDHRLIKMGVPPDPAPFWERAYWTARKGLIPTLLDRLTLDDHSVVVLDEASLVDTRRMALLVEKVREADAKLVLVGDREQLPAISRGGAFEALGDRLGRATLSEIVRQKEPWARKAVLDVVRGETRRALEAFAERDQLRVAPNREDAIQQLIADWRNGGGTARPEQHVIFAPTHREVAALNKEAQDARWLRLGVRIAQDADGNWVHFGDRIQFHATARAWGIRNGDCAEVLPSLAGRQHLRVRLDSGEVVTFDADRFRDFSLGYAMTVHKAQGTTVENAYVLFGGRQQNREMTYVELSRARSRTVLFTDRFEVGDTLAQLAAEASRSRRKELAITKRKDESQSPTHGQELRP